MSKLEDIRRILSENPKIVWNEQTVLRRHLRKSGSFESVAVRLAPREPILTSRKLQAFSADLEGALSPIGPTNMTKCYEYAETYRDVIKTATLYFVDPVEDSAEGATERRVSLTIYPCLTMAEHEGVRGLIEIRHYPCPRPCEEAKKCTFRGYDNDPLSSVRTAWFR
ncbi:MAG: hypothetical protein FJZ95_01560 [Chloroflexi bacterium]|nr:hypothetical protein [Chloroflexota bacterium]